MANNTNKADIVGLKRFYKDDKIAKIIFDHLAKFVNNMSTTNLDQLLWRLSDAEKNPPSRSEAIRFFRRLEQLECGRLVEGRRGKRTRFVWDSNLTDVAHAAAGQDVKIGDAPMPGNTEAAPDSESQNEGLLEHPYRLRKNLDLRLRLPSDLTKAEAARLAAFVQTLPFDTNQTS